MAWLSAGLSVLTAAIVCVPPLEFLIAPASRRPREQWRDVGSIDDFTIGDTVEARFVDAVTVPWAGQAAESAVWLRRKTESEFVAFSLTCTHLGCPVRWESGARLFMCPCHGGVYYEDGSVAGGPPPRALAQYPTRVEGRQVQVQTRALSV